MRRQPVWIIIFTVVLDTLGIGILVPVVPQLLGNQASPHYLLSPDTSQAVAYVLLGLLVATYPVMQFFSTPILGQLSDRYGRRPVLAASLIGTSFGYVLFALGIVFRNVPILFVARALDGLTGGNVSVAQAAIADVTAPGDRTKNFGLMGAAFGVGFILGPFLGGTLADRSIVPWFDAATPFWFAAILAAANALSVLLQFTETNRHMRHVRVDVTRSLHNIARAYMLADLRPIFVTAFFLNAGFGFFISFFGMFLIDRFAFNEGQIGRFFAYVGLWMVFTQTVTTRVVASRLPEPRVLRATLMGVALVMAAYTVAPAPAWIFLIAPFGATFNGLSFANIGGLLSRSVAPDVQGEILGIGSSIQALAQALPPLGAGFIAARFAPTGAVVAASLSIAVAWVTFVTFYRPIQLASTAVPHS
jgi:DHA1 family tetracycline resistance protein-like MFS transporter